MPRLFRAGSTVLFVIGFNISVAIAQVQEPIDAIVPPPASTEEESPVVQDEPDACEANIPGNSYYVSADGGGSSCSLERPCGVSSGMARANAGDAVVLLDGVYNRCIGTARSGAPNRPITIRAYNTFGAVIRGNGNESQGNCGINVRHSNLVISGLRFEQHYGAIWGDSGRANNVEVRDNLIYHFVYDGIRLRGSDWYIHNNVIGLSQQTAGDNGAAVSLRGNTHNNQIVNNVVYAINNDNWQVAPPVNASKYGICFNIFAPASGNLIQGNICMGAEKSNMTIWTAVGSSHTNANNVVRDNIWAYSEGGGFSPRDRRSNDNAFINNICYSTHGCASGKGNTPGRNQILHNTAIVTEFSGPVAFEAGRDTGVTEQNRAFKSNLAYSTVVHDGNHNNYLNGVMNASATYGNRHTHNLYGAPWSRGNLAWSRQGSFTLSSTDIVAQPQFNDTGSGDFTLAPGSPGAGAGHDGQDIGIAWNAHLTATKFQGVFSLPTQTQDTPGTSATFSGLDAGREYQVYAYVPRNGYYTGTENFSVEGNRVRRELGYAFGGGNKWYSGSWYSGANRWISLGNHAVSSDGVLNVNWQHGNAAEHIFIRALPVPAEAYRWVMDCAPPNMADIPFPPSGGGPPEPEDIDWGTVIGGGAAAGAAVAVISQVISAPDSHIDEFEFLSAIDGSCIDLQVAPLGCASLFCPTCSIVSWWQPIAAVEMVKKPGDTIIGGGVLSQFLGEAAEAVADIFGRSSSMSGGGSRGISPSGASRNKHFYIPHVWLLPDFLGNTCGPRGNGQGSFLPSYLGEMDGHWWTAEQTSPGLPGMPFSPFPVPMGVGWGSLAPLGGHISNPSKHGAAASLSVRGYTLAVSGMAMLPPRPVITPAEPSACIQPAWPREKSCMPVGTHRSMWDRGIYTPSGKELFFYWARRSTCVPAEQALTQVACVEVARAAVLDRNTADNTPVPCIP